MRRSIVVALAAGVAVCLAAGLPGAALGQEHDHGEGGSPDKPLIDKSGRFVPKEVGTKETTTWWFGPYAVAPGHDGNRIDLELPVQDGMMVSAEPAMRRVEDLSEPSHQEAHIHHAHWFALDPGNEEDNYTGGNTEWIFGNGDEETKADFQPRSAAEPDGPVYGEYIQTPQVMIYMLHNKTSQPLNVYIALDVTFIHGSPQELSAHTGREHHDVAGILFGRTYDVPRQNGNDHDQDGTYEYAEDSGRVIEWTSTVEGTMIGTGGHLHPGGLSVIVENYGSADNPCRDDGRGYGGTQLLKSDALFRNDVLFSEDFQMEVTHPAWRAPIRKGDRIRISGTYESRDHAWYDVMTHEGIYVDEAQPPRDQGSDGSRDCSPELVGGATGDATEGVPNRDWGAHEDAVCDPTLPDGPPPACEPGTWDPQERIATDTVTIAGFLYLPGDQGASGQLGALPQVEEGSSLRFVNADQQAGIRHTVTTCPWPCDGRYVANYPLPDGDYDSNTLGYDPVDGGEPNPIAETPTDLKAGKYAFFCRIHPWMRGGFEVVPEGTARGSAFSTQAPLSLR